MIIENEEFAKNKLEENNYYNVINGYKDIFLNRSKDGKTFFDDTTFEQIFALYTFDRNIRNIFLSYIIEIENILRSLISYEFSKKHGRDNYLIFDNFETLFPLRKTKSKKAKELIEERAYKITEFIAEMQQDLAQATKKSKYVKHYMLKYGFVPLWVLINSITLGRLSKFFSLMKQEERVNISKKWNILETDLKQYIKILAIYRNQCAHDERIYNFDTGKISISDTIYHEKLSIPIINGRYTNGKNDLFSVVIIFKMLLPKSDFTAFCNKLSGQLYSLSKKINGQRYTQVTEMMGFPSNWFEIKKS